MHEFDRLVKEASEWAKATFPVRTVSSIAKHLEEEAQELHNDPEDLHELVDCMLLVLDAANAAGLSGDDLIRITFDKLEICKQREWQEPDENGVVRHKK